MTNHNDLMITPEAALTAGTVTYWRLSGGVNLARLRDAWTARGLEVKGLPTPPSAAVALGRAVRLESGPRTLVRPLATESTWAIVQEAADNATVAYNQLCVVEFNGTEPVFTRVNASPNEYEPLVARIRANFDKQKGELASEDISTWLVKIVKRLNAVPLRDTGGIYFVPRANADLWQRVAQALEAVSVHAVFRIPAMRNDEAVRAITDAVTQEADAAVKLMYAQLTELGERALKNRREACDALLTKIAEYDALLGTQLKVREQVTGLRAAIATAMLMASDEAA